MPERMQARVFRLPDGFALLIEHDLAVVILDDRAYAGRDQRRQEAANDDVLVVLDVALAVGEGEIKLTLWRFQLPFAQRVQDRLRDRYRSVACFALGAANGVV